MNAQLKTLISELNRAEDEERADIYLLNLHLQNADDLKFFSGEERVRVTRLISFLIKETKHHSELLAVAARELEHKAKQRGVVP